VIVFGAELPAGRTIIDAVVCTIVLSVLLHGLSANPLVRRLGTGAPGSARDQPIRTEN
jgi:NhaP-type Na+/H+ or K+/H+ antiporter